MRKAIILLLLSVLTILFHPHRTIAQQSPAQQDMSIDSQTRGEVILNLLKELDDSYVFPETAKKMEADIRERMSKNEYDQITSARAFAEKLTSDLQSVSHD
jgi:hypothetical protein